MDGVTDNDFFFSAPSNVPSENSVAEFKVQNGLYGAQYGQGSAQVNVAIKSGTNKIHGTAYDFFQNDALQPKDPRTAALNALNNTSFPLKTPFKQNQFGGTLRGRLIIPKLYNGRDKTFWFFGYDGGRQSTSPGVQSIALSACWDLLGVGCRRRGPSMRGQGKPELSPKQLSTRTAGKASGIDQMGVGDGG